MLLRCITLKLPTQAATEGLRFDTNISAVTGIARYYDITTSRPLYHCTERPQPEGEEHRGFDGRGLTNTVVHQYLPRILPRRAF